MDGQNGNIPASHTDNDEPLQTVMGHGHCDCWATNIRLVEQYKQHITTLHSKG